MSEVGTIADCLRQRQFRPLAIRVSSASATLSRVPRGREIVEQLRPEESDYFVLKPKHSGILFDDPRYAARLLKSRNRDLTGVTANVCVLFTADDAYMRDLKIVVPQDCVASNTKELNDFAIKQIETVLKADILRSEDLSQAALALLVSRGQLASA